MNPQTQTMKEASNIQQIEAKSKELFQKLDTVINDPKLHDEELLETALSTVENLIQKMEQRLNES